FSVPERSLQFVFDNQRCKTNLGRSCRRQCRKRRCWFVSFLIVNASVKRHESFTGGEIRFEMTKHRIIVLGTLAANPYAGMAWMHMQLALGLKRLGHDVYYFEVSSLWPYDPIRQYKVSDSQYALPYLERVMESFDFRDRWAYRRSYSDGQWFGID